MEIQNLKIPTLVIISLLLGFGTQLLIASVPEMSVNFVVGLVLIIAGFIMSILSYCSYHEREKHKDIISHLQTSLDTVTKTHTAESKSHLEYVTTHSFPPPSSNYQPLEQPIKSTPSDA